ncbi:unnamed protein product, partial [Meganyctiphanes norvegica]
SDEEGCSAIIPAPNICSDYGDMFMCDGNSTCLESSKRCDRNHDCIDLTDEFGCTNETIAVKVSNLILMATDNTSLKVAWDEKYIGHADPPIEYLPSIVQQSAASNHKAWKNDTWTTSKSHLFKDLTPNTVYLVKIYAKYNKTIFPPLHREIKYFTTEVGVPTSPLLVKVHQQGENLTIEWTAPLKPNGHIVAYHVYVSHPSKDLEYKVEEGTSLTLQDIKSIFYPNERNLTVWVTAENNEYISPSSDKKIFQFKIVDSPIKVRVQFMDESSVTLTWDPVDKVDGYLLSYIRKEKNIFITGKRTKDIKKTTVTVDNLAPGVTYIFDVQSYMDDLRGPPNTLEVTMKGTRVPAPPNFKATNKNFTTTVNLTWDPPLYKEKRHWSYSVMWGKSTNELKQTNNTAEMSNTSYEVDGLEACQTYSMAVMVSKPIGYGRVSQIQIETGEDPLAPPKNVRVETKFKNCYKNCTLVITWDSSCPGSESYTDLMYLLDIKEITRNEPVSTFKLPGGNHLNVKHHVHLHWGGHYRVNLSTIIDDEASGPKVGRSSKPIFVDGPEYPAPKQLEYIPNGNDDTFYWRSGHESSDMPEHILKMKPTFVLYVSYDKNLSKPRTYESKTRNLVVPDLQHSTIYYAAVALKDDDGYYSPKSPIIGFQKDPADIIVMSKTSVVGVVTSVVVVVLLLLAVVAVLAVRHRRLARSFITFANTHYDRNQGTTLITTADNNLDEDDDSPMIRGFSDDEPLVIA